MRNIRLKGTWAGGLWSGHVRAARLSLKAQSPKSKLREEGRKGYPADGVYRDDPGAAEETEPPPAI